MKSMHLTDELLQDYVFTGILDENATKHLASCDQCIAQLKAYQNLSSTLNTLAVETFSFNTSSLVIQKIEMRRKKKKIELNLFYTSLLGLILVPVYFILPMIVTAFNVQLIDNAAMVLLVTGTLCVISFLVIDMFRTQKEKELKISL